MFIHCDQETVENKDIDFKYVNRPINLDQIISFGKATVTPKNTDIMFYTIKFTHSKTLIVEWFFSDVARRDNCFHSILAAINSKLC